MRIVLTKKSKEICDLHLNSLRLSIDAMKYEKYDRPSWECRDFLTKVTSDAGAPESVRQTAEYAAMDLIRECSECNDPHDIKVERMRAAAEFTLAMAWTPPTESGDSTLTVSDAEEVRDFLLNKTSEKIEAATQHVVAKYEPPLRTSFEDAVRGAVAKMWEIKAAARAERMRLLSKKQSPPVAETATV